MRLSLLKKPPDTVISLKSGKKMLVKEKADAVINKMIEFYRLANQMPKVITDSTDEFPLTE